MVLVMQRESIEIIVNGMKEMVPEGSTIKDLIELYKEEDLHLIVERNGSFVYPRDYSNIRVAHGDRIEFINPSFGG